MPDSEQVSSDRPEPRRLCRTINAGGAAKAELRDLLRRHSILMNAQGEQLFESMPEPATFVQQIHIVERTVRQLGFPAGTRSASLVQHASATGLLLCPLEVGPRLRLQYLNQPPGGRIIVASERMLCRTPVPTGFYLQHRDDGLWLRGYTADPEHLWDPDDRFVFLT